MRLLPQLDSLCSKLLLYDLSDLKKDPKLLIPYCDALLNNPEAKAIHPALNALKEVVLSPDLKDHKKFTWIQQKILSYKNQISPTWLIERMAAMGYDSEKIHEGICFGLSHMASHAFLSDDMEKFWERLNIINTLSIEHFEALKDLNLTTIQDDDFGFKGKNAKEIRQILVDIRAFFDGIALVLAPGDFSEIYPQDGLITQSSSYEITKKIIMPVKLQGNESTLIGKQSGVYIKGSDDLAQTLQGLKENLNASFSLEIGHANHSIQVNYHSNTKSWSLIDSNQLIDPITLWPQVKEFSDESLLATAIQEGFDFEIKSNTLGYIMETSIYTKKSDAFLLSQKFDQLSQQEEWNQLQYGTHFNKSHLTFGKTTLVDNEINSVKRTHHLQWVSQHAEALDKTQKIELFEYCVKQALYKDDPHLLLEIVEKPQLVTKEIIGKFSHELFEDAIALKSWETLSVLQEKKLLSPIQNSNWNKKYLNSIQDSETKTTELLDKTEITNSVKSSR